MSKEEAEFYKQTGNSCLILIIEYYSEHQYEQAILEYNKAICKNPENSVYYSNRGLAFLKLYKYQNVLADAEKTLSLDSLNIKAMYMLGQALVESDDFNDRIGEAIHSLQKAYSCSLDQRKYTMIDDICKVLQRAKKKKWLLLEQQRKQHESQLYKKLHHLLSQDCLIQSKSMNELDQQVCKERLKQELKELDRIFDKPAEKTRSRDVPDEILGKITMEIMTDPVITPCGITFDRPELLKHFEKIGHFNPLTRKPLYESDLIPNLALKEFIDHFLDENGWAVDF